MVISSNALAYIAVINNYLTLLAAGDVRGIVSLFSPRGTVHSPFLGVQPVGKFFDLLKAATRRSIIESPEVFVSGVGSRRASTSFTYRWELADGAQVSFECVDLFDFDEQGLIEAMTIVYDTAPIRDSVGDKYRGVQTQ
ncbi:SnoaL-like domain-containing protein [Polaromonas sp. YR568]|uniref:nuclear transport factor 2 family protein n=1 Tax=Polaromonas sp. YR568 TaxID=1855301 RepID=UPI0008E5D46C|nr:nuclear transport factor 2 family protein [Polaromonas sp. YR568]SFV04137.1 SnoaL-like domain-containing protein [Polaromonas sp. YR568]